MTPKIHKVPLRQMHRFFLEAVRYHYPGYSVFMIQGNSGKMRLSLLLPKKTATKAVQRSALKRMYSEQLGPLLSLQRSVDCVVRIQDARKAHPRNIYDTLTTLLARTDRTLSES